MGGVCASGQSLAGSSPAGRSGTPTTNSGKGKLPSPLAASSTRSIPAAAGPPTVSTPSSAARKAQGAGGSAGDAKKDAAQAANGSASGASPSASLSRTASAHSSRAGNQPGLTSTSSRSKFPTSSLSISEERDKVRAQMDVSFSKRNDDSRSGSVSFQVSAPPGSASDGRADAVDLEGPSRQRSDSYRAAMLQNTEPKSTQDFEKLRALLNAHPWFSSHSPSQIDDMARFMKSRTYTRAPDQPAPFVYTAGKPDDYFYVVRSGEFLLVEAPPTAPSASVSTMDSQAGTGGGGGSEGSFVNQPNADRPQQQVLGEWSSFGESALRFKGFPRSESVSMTSATGELWTIAATEYQSLIVKDQVARDRGRLGFLRSVKLLAQLTDEQIMVLSKNLVRQVFKPKDRIIKQGTPGSEFFFVERGRVVAYQKTQKGDREIVAKVNEFLPGDYFGEGAMLRNEPRNADCVAEGNEDVVTLVLRRNDFVDLLGGLEKILEWNFRMRTLNAIELLTHLTDSERQVLCENLEEQKFAPGEVIIQQGEKGDKLYIIKEGEIVFTRQRTAGSQAAQLARLESAVLKAATESGGSTRSLQHDPTAPIVGDSEFDGEELVGPSEEIGRLFTGQVFGEGALLTDAPRRATAKAIDNVTCLVLDRSVFQKVFDQSLQDMLNRDFTKRRDLDEANRKDLLEFKDLETIDLLGVGTYGQVLLVSHRVTGATYALKCMSKKRVREMDQREHVENERKILAMIYHPFVVNLVQTFQSPDHVFALTEAVLGGELFAYLRSVARLKPRDARFYLAQIVLVFEYLHSLNVIFRDLKPENLLLTQQGNVKMVDFGLAKIVEPGESTYTLCGTPAYAAPEVYGMKGHSKPVDWWGLGVLCHELISGATPFDGDAAGIFDSMQRYARAYPNIRLPRRLEGSLAGDMTIKLLHPNPYKRLGSSGSAPGSTATPTMGSALGGARAVKAHPFFDDLVWNDLARSNIEPPYKPKIEGGYDTRNFYEPTVDNDGVVDLQGVDVNAVVPGQVWTI